MKIAQIYDTTIYDCESGWAARAIIVPRRSFANPTMLDQPRQLVRELELENIRTVAVGELTQTVVEVLEGSGPEVGPRKGLESQSYPSHRMLPNAFAEYLVSARIIPFEQSPLSAETIGSIAAASGVGTGAAVALLVAAGASPFLLLLVPAGMIVMGAAAGIAKGLEKGLQKRVEDLVKGEKSKPPKPPKSFRKGGKKFPR